jgi:hypothetical protein
MHIYTKNDNTSINPNLPLWPQELLHLKAWWWVTMMGAQANQSSIPLARTACARFRRRCRALLPTHLHDIDQYIDLARTVVHATTTPEVARGTARDALSEWRKTIVFPLTLAHSLLSPPIAMAVDNPSGDDSHLSRRRLCLLRGVLSREL